MSTPKLSIVIPTYNSSSLILRCLRSLESQSAAKSEFEVIVVDDGSEDDTCSVLRRYASRSDLQLHVVQAQHGGPGIARNQGIARAQAEWIAFLDADIITTPRWVARGLQLIQSPSSIAGFEGRTDIGNSDQVTPFTHQTTNESGGRYPTCNLILRKRFCNFYPGYKIPFREDTDLAFAILEAGYEIAFDEQLLAHHPPLSPKYNRPLCLAMRYYYDSLLEKRFPKRYKNDVDVHYIGGIRIPHLRKKIYCGFIMLQMAFLAALYFEGIPQSWVGALGVGHGLSYLIVLMVHLNHTKVSQLKWKEIGIVSLLSFIVPWVLFIQRWRGYFDFRNEPEFSVENWQSAAPTVATQQSGGTYLGEARSHFA